MDGSFLSDETVVTASRGFVCIRLATYEDEREATFLSKLFPGRSGLENTVFALLHPDGKTTLTRTGRSPHFAFSNATEMADFMTEALKEFEPTLASGPKPLPKMNSLDVALNVAACDKLHLVVTVSNDLEERNRLESQLAKCAWQRNLIGQFCYVTAPPTELESLAGVRINSGLLIVEPNDFGVSGIVMDQLAATSSHEQLEAALKQALRDRILEFTNYRKHIRTGVDLGMEWKTKIPVTDRESLDAKKRYRGAN